VRCSGVGRVAKSASTPVSLLRDRRNRQNVMFEAKSRYMLIDSAATSKAVGPSVAVEIEEEHTCDAR